MRLNSLKSIQGYKLSLTATAFCLLVACAQNENINPEVEAPAASSASEMTAENLSQPKLKANVSQQFLSDSEIDQRLAEALPEIPYTTDNLSGKAQAVNTASWQVGVTTPQTLKPQQILKIQALLNWHHHKVGALDGKFSKNTVKAMQAFQFANNLPVTHEMNDATWQVLTQNQELANQPVLVNYTLTADDTHLNKFAARTNYRSVEEYLGEKFQMSKKLIRFLNPNTSLKAGNVITVYNPAQPNTQAITRVIADKSRNTLFAYNEQNELVASYPTTVGGSASPSPVGTYKVMNRHINPSYNKDFKQKHNTIPGGPNNPVGRVWMGLNKKSYGIHGSPEPEMISRQASHGCVRLTNWDALSLFGTMQDGAEVKFVEKDYIKSQLAPEPKMDMVAELKKEKEKMANEKSRKHTDKSA